MRYQEFLEHIYKRYSGNVKLGLERMEGLLKDLGNPQYQLTGFHVAGTNGKGSVCATLESLALAHGLKTGLNTSPHLVDYNERFRINGKQPEFELILQIFLEHEKLFNKWEASFFEISTAIALILFVRNQVDCAVIEVGLGGRLDATNLFIPDVAAITNIGLDHVKTLGGSLELIATEKAGMIKQNVPLVLGDMEQQPFKVISDKASQLNAPLSIWNRDYQATNLHNNIAGIMFDYHYQDYHFRGLQANLLGEHQATNLAMALTAFIIYANKHGIQVSEAAVRKGLSQINWQGRMQLLSKSPAIILDGAHNLHGVKALIRTLDLTFPDIKPRFLISILADKDFSAMLGLMASRAAHIYLAKNNSDRAATIEEQMAVLKNYPVAVSTHPSVAEAWDAARAELKQEDLLVCGGSLFTVGELLAHLDGDKQP
ncbi:MAG: bifunctional folylpolyglutamate synthase/dihydrofolate synthase [Candidatus Cloacimonetes bacterium]|nr:bifunctional folylpolyglutamate synthase/dihydrofolate synthase [Candidatus Cloacimonadota bacterium]